MTRLLVAALIGLTIGAGFYYVIDERGRTEIVKTREMVLVSEALNERARKAVGKDPKDVVRLTNEIVEARALVEDAKKREAK